MLTLELPAPDLHARWVRPARPTARQLPPMPPPASPAGEAPSVEPAAVIDPVALRRMPVAVPMAAVLLYESIGSIRQFAL